MQYRIQFLDSSAKVIREWSDTAQNVTGVVAIVVDADWPPAAVTMRVLDAYGQEVHSVTEGDTKKWDSLNNREIELRHYASDRERSLDARNRESSCRPARLCRARAVCRAALKRGLIDSWCKWSFYNGIIRARSNSTPARPYMARLRVFNLLICPSVCPLLQGSDTAFRTASRSWRIVLAKRCIA